MGTSLAELMPTIGLNHNQSINQKIRENKNQFTL